MAHTTVPRLTIGVHGGHPCTSRVSGRIAANRMESSQNDRNRVANPAIAEATTAVIAEADLRMTDVMDPTLLFERQYGIQNESDNAGWRNPGKNVLALP